MSPATQCKTALRDLIIALVPICSVLIAHGTNLDNHYLQFTCSTYYMSICYFLRASKGLIEKTLKYFEIL